MYFTQIKPIIFAGQVCDSLSLINTLADLASDALTYRTQHENNITWVSQWYMKGSTANSCLNNIILFNILGILNTNNYFFNKIGFIRWEKDDNSYQPLEGSDTRTKSAKWEMREVNWRLGLLRWFNKPCYMYFYTKSVENYQQIKGREF